MNWNLSTLESKCSPVLPGALLWKFEILLWLNRIRKTRGFRCIWESFFWLLENLHDNHEIRITMWIWTKVSFGTKLVKFYNLSLDGAFLIALGSQRLRLQDLNPFMHQSSSNLLKYSWIYDSNLSWTAFWVWGKILLLKWGWIESINAGPASYSIW